MKKFEVPINCFHNLGKGALSSSELVNGELPQEVNALETFVCKGYSPKGSTTLPALRWDLFRSKHLEAEMLPPARTTLMPHVVRTNFICMQDKSCLFNSMPPSFGREWMVTS